MIGGFEADLGGVSVFGGEVGDMVVLGAVPTLSLDCGRGFAAASCTGFNL